MGKFWKIAKFQFVDGVFMNSVVNVLAILGSIFIFSNLFDLLPHNILQNIGFLIWAIMDFFNAKIHRDKGEKKKAIIILVCAIILFCVSAWGLLPLLL